MKLVVGMLVKNEADRYLLQVLNTINGFADELVVLDDHSTDSTLDLMMNLTKVPLIIGYNDRFDFSNEIVLRKQLYQMVMEREPDWYLMLDADEILHGANRKVFELLMSQNEVDAWGFRLYDMWDDQHYRSDELWKAHQAYSYLLVRYIPGFKAIWNETPQHCGRVPKNIGELRLQGTELIRIKHLGWAREYDRLAKYWRYKKLDPEARYGNKDQYESILDPYPHLERWVD